MRRFLLFVLLALLGAMLYFMYADGLIYWQFIPLMAIVIAIYYVSANVVTKHMVEKQRGEKDFFIVKGNISSNDGKELIIGALVATKNELVFYRRKSAFGGLQIVWSGFVSALEEYTMGKIDDQHYGITLSFRGGEIMKIGSASISKKEPEFRAAIGWPEE